MSAFQRPRTLAIGLLVWAMAAAHPYSARADASAPQVIEVLMRDGENALAADRFSEAFSRFSEVLRLDWNHPRAYELLQEVRYARDLTLLKWESDARDAESRRDLSQAKWIYERILNEDSTREDLKERVRRLGRQRDAADFVRSGMEKFIADDFAGAQVDFEQALAVNSKDTLAIQYRERARQKIAASSSLAAIQTDTAGWGQYLEALRKLRAGDLLGAEKLWTGLLTKYPGNESILSNLDQVRKRLGNESAIANDE